MRNLHFPLGTMTTGDDAPRGVKREKIDAWPPLGDGTTTTTSASTENGMREEGEEEEEGEGGDVR